MLLLEKLSELLGQPLQIGKGGLREGVILDLLNGSINGSPERARGLAVVFDQGTVEALQAAGTLFLSPFHFGVRIEKFLCFGGPHLHELQSQIEIESLR